MQARRLLLLSHVVRPFRDLQLRARNYRLEVISAGAGDFISNR